MEKGIRSRTFITFLVTILVGIAVLSGLFILFIKKHSGKEVIVREKVQLEKEVAELKKKNAELQNLRDGLLYDPTHVEKSAREELGYSMPDEVPYKRLNFELKESSSKDATRDATKQRPFFKTKTFIFIGFPLFILLMGGLFYLSYRYESRKLR